MIIDILYSVAACVLVAAAGVAIAYVAHQIRCDLEAASKEHHHLEIRDEEDR